MEYVVCNRNGCPSKGKVLPLNFEVPEDQTVFCGGCGNPCTRNVPEPTK